MKWDESAREAVSKAPFFVRKRIVRRVEEEASRVGAEVVRLEHVRSCQRRFLDNMENDVQGWRIETCFGSGGCPNRTAADDGLAARIEGRLKEADLKAFLKSRVRGPLKMHHEFRVSLSDCPNACSRPQIADVGLIGARRPRVRPEEPCSQCRACVEVCQEEAIGLSDKAGGPVLDDQRCLACGRCIEACPSGTIVEGDSGWRFQVGGRLGRHPRLAREVAGLHGAEQVLAMIEGAIEHYKANNRRGERFGDVLGRTGWEPEFDSSKE
ncbi:MAG: 4Fe-4S binding protein [Proteobacteria bacterium]|nr:4Fe-4S binding protein [Pseudomonadota bacterium]